MQEHLEKQMYRALEEHIVDVQQENIQSNLLGVTNDLMILSLNNEIDDLWESTFDKEVVEELSSDLLELSLYRGVYDQIRLIDEDGMEIIRVNYNNGKPIIVPQENLQNKKDRYYFIHTLKLNRHEFYISPLDLNIEKGIIENPLKPMMRIGTPMFDKHGKKRGIIVFNFFGQIIINQVVDQANPIIDNQVMLLNSESYWLKGGSPEHEWGFMYPHKKDLTFANSYKNAWERIRDEVSSQFETEKGLFTSKTIYPIPERQIYYTNTEKIFPLAKVPLNTKDYFWKIVSYIPSEILYTKINKRRKYAALILVFLAVGIFYISRRFYSTQQYKYNAQLDIKDVNDRFHTTMNSIDAGVYVSDFKTYELLFVNKFISDIFGDVVGKKCYASLQKDQNSPCDFCTNHLLINENGEPNEPYIWEFQNTIIQRWYQCRDRAIQWTDGRLVRLEIITDITERKQTEDALSKSEHRLREAQETAHIGHWELDLKTKNLYWSDEVYRIFNLEPQEIEASFDSFLELIHPDDRKISIKFHDDLRINISDSDITHRIKLNNGQTKYVHERCNYIFNDKNNPLFLIGTLADVTEMVEKEIQIKHQNEKLNELNATKDKFFSIIAHDLKSPFNSILGLLKLLIGNFDKFDIKEQKEFIFHIEKSAKTGHRLLENLLTWSRSQTGNIKFNPEKENLQLLIKETLNLLCQSAENKSLNITNDVSSELVVLGDKDMLSTLIRNLVSNAIKFTPKGGTITIQEGIKSNDNSQSYAEIIVKDNGVGISPEIKSKLFNITENISTKGTEEETGTGLGLILCKEFVEKHGGEIWVESEKGKGSKFIFTLPLSDAQ